MRIYKNIKLAIILAIMLLVTPLSIKFISSKKSITTNSKIEKPQIITFSTFSMLNVEDGLHEFLLKFKEKTGIELVIVRSVLSHRDDNFKHLLASGRIKDIDVIELSGRWLPQYVSKGALHDITDLVASSEVLKKVDKKYIDALKIEDRIFAFPNNAGNGAVTYLRKDWLDKHNLTPPKNYNEFINALKKFSESSGDVIPFTAPGLISDDPSLPGTIYLTDFYQDAKTDIYQNKNGKWIDGMREPNMRAALERLRSAYKAGLIDKDIATNRSSTLIEKFTAGQAGACTYWAGNWNVTLEEALKKADKDAEIIVIPPIKETKYIERLPSLALAISSGAENKEGIFKYFIEYLQDGGEGQMLFTNGFQDFSYKIENGVYSKLPSKSGLNTPFPKIYLTPELSVNNWNNPFKLDERITDSLKLLNDNSIMLRTTFYSETYEEHQLELLSIKKNVITKAVLGLLSIDEALDYYDEKTRSIVDRILMELNNLK